MPHSPTSEADWTGQEPTGGHGNDLGAATPLHALLVSAAVSAGSGRLRERELEGLAARVPQRQFLAGRRVLGRGDPVEHLSLIHSGRVGLVWQSAGRVILSVLGTGDLLGETALLLGTPAPWEAVALVDTTVLDIPAGSVLAALEDESALASQWIIGASARLAAAWDRLEELLAGDLRSQVASLLLRELGGGADVFLTQQVIADMLGARRTSVTRVLGDLRRRRLIALGYGRITLLDRDGLAALATTGVGWDGWPARRVPVTDPPRPVDPMLKPGAAA
jgi:CRP-like cAMP-binding protein